MILGGGVAGVATAFWLTAPQQNNRFKVTLYTQGWRLGGKCASGRNESQSNRIEEHGLHLLMGCYQNAFATIRSCYQVWHRPAGHPFKTWQDAFLPQRDVTLMEQDGPGEPPAWEPWDFHDFARLPGEPGDPMSLMPSLETMDAMQTSIAIGSAPARIQVPPAQISAGAGQSMEHLILRMIEFLRKLDLPSHVADDYHTALNGLHEAMVSPATVAIPDVLESLEAVNRELATLAQQPFALPAEAAHLLLNSAWPTSRSAHLASIGLAIGYGYLRDIVGQGAGQGEAAYDALNDKDFREWLKSCGASQAALESAPIRALYDLAFAFLDGDASTIDNGSMAAGVALRFACEAAFGYRNAPLWRMAAGTGDTVFVPFYEVLKDRGVDIHFFHRATALRPTADGSSVGEIDLSRQADILGGAIYQPLKAVGSLSSWPNQPNWDQLVDGNLLKGQNLDFESSFCTTSVGTVTLKAGPDYDVAVVALPPAVLKTVAAPLSAASPRWQTAISKSRSVATAGMQLWMKDSMPNLGWPYGPAVLSAYAEPYDSWGDMSAVIPFEEWPAATAPKSLAYFCGCLQLPAMGPINPMTMLQLAQTNENKWLTDNIQPLWDNVPAPANWGPTGAEIARYDRANFEGSELYVQTPAGDNVASRFSSGGTAGFSNLCVVGDWTKTRFSGGCFESAVESAMLAANALGGFPPLDEIKTD
ncbi:MAG TPA: NAD(P)-binding protein [Rhodopila sp.]|nr:NAD(P)-binding protein [Rhodopila sp.]